MGHEDIEGIESDLHALRKLYGLLQTNLDEKARLLLKNLLDGAAERIFEAHSEIISTHLRDMLKLQPSNFVNVSQKLSSSVAQSTPKGLSAKKVAALPNKDERIMRMSSLSKPLTTILQQQQRHPLGLEQSNSMGGSTKPENRRKKRCRVCRQSSVKQLKPTKSALPNEETQNPTSKDNNTINLLLQNQRQAVYNLPTTYSFSNGGGPNKGLVAALSNSERRAKRQKQQSRGRNNTSEFKGACSFKNATAAGVVQSGGARHNNINNFTSAKIVEERSHTRDDEEEACDVIEVIESCIVALQQVVTLAKQVGPKQFLPQHSNDYTNDMPPLASQIPPSLSPAKHESNDCHLKETIMKKQPASLVSSVGSTSTTGPPPPLDRRSAIMKNGKGFLGLPQKKTSRRHGMISTDSDGTASSLLCSSTPSDWTSQPGGGVSVTSSEECGFLTTGETQSHHYRSLSTGTSSNSNECQVGPTSSNDSLANTIRARLVVGGSTSSSSPTRHQHAYNQTVAAGSTSSTSRRGIGLIRKNNNGKWAKPETQQVGRLRKFKDKLAIIFHHDDRQGVDKVRKSAVVRNVSLSVKKKQKEEGHLRRLVEGLLNHVRHSKKKSKVGIRQLEKGRKHTVVKKLHWWQMLRSRQRGGARVSNKQQHGSTVKMHVKKLKALPKIR